MSNTNALFLLADHIKLSLLERQRAKALNLESDTQDGHISRSLDQLRDGLESLEKEHKRLEEAGDETKASTIADSLPELQKQLNDLTSQFHGFSSPSTSATLTSPNDPSLAADFAHATSTKPISPTSPSPSSTDGQRPGKRPGPKTVRFSDTPSDLEAARPRVPSPSSTDPSATALFGPYRDDPSQSGLPEYSDRAGATAAAGMDNVQVHEYHQQIIEEQDAQLDVLGASIGRQRELSMQIGDELDSQVMMLDESERVVDRHQGRLDRARRQVGRVARSAGESKQMVAIIVLIVVLILLIAISR